MIELTEADIEQIDRAFKVEEMLQDALWNAIEEYPISTGLITITVLRLLYHPMILTIRNGHDPAVALKPILDLVINEAREIAKHDREILQ